MQVSFGAGTIIGKRTDVSGTQPAFLGIAQEWSIDWDQELVTLVGQNKVAIDVAPGELKITGKVKAARIMSTNFNNLFFGQTLTAASGFDMATSENHSAIGGTTFAVTNGSTFLEDLGLFYHASGVALIPTTATPSVGYYIPGVAAAGIVTINAGDESVAGGLDAYYTFSLTTLFETDISNQPMGTGAVFELVASVPYAVQGVAKKFNIKLNACRATKLPWAFKNKAYMVPEMDFTAFADAAGNIGKYALSE